jgi:SAM-dependent methyltransferase
MPASDATRRFTSKAWGYDRHRPGYPPGILALLRSELGLDGAVVADVGSGTGLFTAALLAHAAIVYAVEPNDAMRVVAEQRYGGKPAFRSIPGRAEDTGLADEAVELVTAAQAFHWFDPVLAPRELRRIARPGAGGLLAWNSRDRSDRFVRGYDAVMAAHCPAFRASGAAPDDDEVLPRLFGPGGWAERTMPNPVRMDWHGLVGRALSASYAPDPGDPGHDELVAALRDLFEAHADDGRVTMAYRTVAYFGPLASGA